MSLRRAVLVALVAFTVPASGARAAGWTAPTTVANVPADHAPDTLFVGMGTTGLPFASWFDETLATLEWTREGPSGWTSPIAVPGLALGGFYGARHVWTLFGRSRVVVRRGIPGQRFGPAEPVGSNNPLDSQTDTAPDGASLLVLVERRRMLVATRRPGRPFGRARVLWRAPIDTDAYETRINARGDGLVVWASRWSILATRITAGRVGPVVRLGPSGGRVDSLDADLAIDGSALIAWHVEHSRRDLHAFSVPPGRLRVAIAVSRPFVVTDIDVLPLQEPGGGVLVWDGPVRGALEGVWAMPVRRGVAQRRRALSPPGRVAEWMVANTSARGAAALLWRESTGSDQSTTLYAAERRLHRWVNVRQRVARPWPSTDQQIDVAINPCDARPTVVWILPPKAGDVRIVSSTGPAAGRPDRKC